MKDTTRAYRRASDGCGAGVGECRNGVQRDGGIPLFGSPDKVGTWWDAQTRRRIGISMIVAFTPVNMNILTFAEQCRHVATQLVFVLVSCILHPDAT